MKHSGWIKIVLVLLCMWRTSFCSNILVMLPLPLFSHTNPFMPLFRELANRGHNVTLVSPFAPPQPVPNLKHIAVKNVLPQGMEAKDVMEMSQWFQAFGIWMYGIYILEMVSEDKALKQLIEDKEAHFDLVITETFFMQEALVGLGHRFSSPVININAAAPTAWVTYLTGNPNPYSYVPSYRVISSDHMNFLQRLKNTLWNTYDLLGCRWYYLPKQEKLMHELFGTNKMPPLIDMLKNTSLTLVDSHFSVGYPRPYQTNMIEVGGLSSLEAKPLPQGLQKVMDTSTEGVVYFTLGSYVRASGLKPELVNLFVSVFGKLKQTVLWKWESDTPIPNLPTNIKTAKWFPQSSILAHKNCRLFITHGGVHGVFEAAYNAVPMVGIPLFADQPFNIKFVEETGFGVGLNFNNLTEAGLTEAIETVIYTSKYKQEALARSLVVRDRPMLVLKNAVYWIEYVLNHKGARHLRPAVLDLSYIQYFLLDIIAFLLLLVVIFTYLTLALCRLCLRPCCKSSTHDKRKVLLQKKNL